MLKLAEALEDLDDVQNVFTHAVFTTEDRRHHASAGV
jgi:transcriptional/translational regulatory protein YebC/TACO1